MLEIVAKSLGHTSAAAMLAAMACTRLSPAAPIERKDYQYCGEEREAAMREKFGAYRLSNGGGLLDLRMPGETAEYLVTRFDWCPVSGTVEVLAGVSMAHTVARDPAALELAPNYLGETEVDWNAQKSSRDSRGVRLWATEEGRYFAEDTCLAVSESLVSAPRGPTSKELDSLQGDIGPNVRVVLVDAVFRYLQDNELTSQALRELGLADHLQAFGPDFLANAEDIGPQVDGALGRAQFAAGFSMHLKEFRLLYVFLTA